MSSLTSTSILVITHRLHEFIRMIEGQLQRLVCGDRCKQYWPLYLNIKPGDLDGTRFPGRCHVIIATTKEPLQQLYDSGKLFRAMSEWYGLKGGAILPTLIQKLRQGDQLLASGAYERPEVAILRVRLSSDSLPYIESLLYKSDLICNADLGHTNHKRKAGTESRCFYHVQCWAVGTVGAHSGVLGHEANGGRHVVIGLNLSEASAVQCFETEVAKKKRNGYHERASLLEEVEADEYPVPYWVPIDWSSCPIEEGADTGW